MHLSILLTTLLTTTSVLAFPGRSRNSQNAPSYGSGGNNNPTPTQCLTATQATAGAEIFRQLIQSYSDQLALDALTEDFIDYSSAVNLIRNRGNEGPIVVNGISFNGRQQFMDAQGSQPQIPFETLNVFYGCDHVAMRWQTTRSANGQATEVSRIPVVGNAILQTVPDSQNQYGFRIKLLLSEFNAGAWMLNLGTVVTTMPNNTTLPARDVVMGVGMI